MTNDNTRLTDDALAELARLAGEATPGPWRAGCERDKPIDGWISSDADLPRGHSGSVCFGRPDPDDFARECSCQCDCTWCGDRYSVGIVKDADAAYIAAANPSTVAALVAEVQRLRAGIGELGRLALRAHVECDDCWYSCPKSEGGTCNEEWHDGECRCGADAHNARVASIRAALDGAE